MNKWFIALVVCSCALPMCAAKKQPSGLMNQLVSEFQGRPFRTRIILGNHVIAYAQAYHQDKERLVDTELSPDGTVKYYVRRGYYDGTDPIMTSGGYIDIGKITGLFSPGTIVWVNKIEMKDDRVELWLSKSRANSELVADYAKLKLMLGRGYEAWEYDRIVEVAARALSIERVQRVWDNESEYKALKAELNRREAAYKQADERNQESRLHDAEDLQATYMKLVVNRVQLGTFGRPDNESTEFRERAAGLEKEIASLKQAVRTQRVDTIRQNLKAQLGDAAKLKGNLQRGKANSVSEWESRKALIAKYQELLSEIDASYISLSANGEVVPSADLADLKKNQSEADSMLSSLSADRNRIELRQLDLKFQAMQNKRSQLESNYMKCFGSPQERAAMQAVVEHLKLMRDNRLLAEQAGNRQAALQIESINRDIRKYKQ